MSSLAEDLLYTTSRLEGTKNNGEKSVGTGFYFLYEQRFFLITNKHVVRGVVAGSFVIPRADIVDGKKTPRLGHGIQLPFTESIFIGHPDDSVDVTAMNLSNGFSEMEARGELMYWKNIQKDNFPTQEIIDKYIGPIEDILFIGYPNGIWDTTNMLPITRRGITATPYSVDFEGQKRFLIDALVFPGSSGSPVFLYYTGSHSDKDGNLYVGGRVHFLGLISSVFFRSERGELQAEEVPTEKRVYSKVQQMIDLGVVFKDSVVVETVEHYVSIVADRDRAN